MRVEVEPRYEQITVHRPYDRIEVSRTRDGAYELRLLKGDDLIDHRPRATPLGMHEALREWRLGEKWQTIIRRYFLLPTSTTYPIG